MGFPVRKNVSRLMNLRWSGQPRPPMELEMKPLMHRGRASPVRFRNAPKVLSLANKMAKAASALPPVSVKRKSPVKRGSPVKNNTENAAFKKALEQYARMEAAIKSRPPVTTSVRKLTNTLGGKEKTRQAFAKINQMLPGFAKMALRRRRLPAIEEETMHNMILARRPNSSPLKSRSPKKRHRMMRRVSLLTPIKEESPMKSHLSSPVKRSPVKSHPARNLSSPVKKRSGFFQRTLKALTIGLAAASGVRGVRKNQVAQPSTALMAREYRSRSLPFSLPGGHRVYPPHKPAKSTNVTRVMTKNEQKARKLHASSNYAYGFKNNKYATIGQLLKRR
jgi:hypothetical protein